MAWTVPYTLVGGTAITAGWANTNVRDNSQYLYAQAHHLGQFVFGSTLHPPPLNLSVINDWNPPGLSTANIIVATPNVSLVELTGIQQQPQGTFFWMINGSGATLRLKHGDARSLPNNRLTTSTLGDRDMQYLDLTAWLFINGNWRVKV